MLQRIQTIFILLAIGIVIPMFFTWFASIIDATKNIYSLNITEIKHFSYSIVVFSQTVPLLAALILAVLMSFISIFLYKKRSKQIKMLYLSITCFVITAALIYIYANFSLPTVVEKVYYNWAVFLPIASILFLWRAVVSIEKDENLIRSMDRLR